MCLHCALFFFGIDPGQRSFDPFLAEIVAGPLPELEDVVVEGFGFVEIEPLLQFASNGTDEFVLIRLFHTFGQGVDAEFPGHGDHCAHDRSVDAVVVVEVAQKVHIELDQVHIKLAEYVQRGIAAAEVVQPEPEALVAGGLELVEKVPGTLGDVLLGDFDDNVVVADSSGISR